MSGFLLYCWIEAGLSNVYVIDLIREMNGRVLGRGLELMVPMTIGLR